MAKNRFKEHGLIPYIILIIVIISVLLIMIELWVNVSSQIRNTQTVQKANSLVSLLPQMILAPNVNRFGLKPLL